MKVYIIAGKAGSGKNTTANYIKKCYEEKDKTVVITEISKYLKSFAYEVKNWDGERETKPRSFLQETGSLIRHELFNEDFFINRLLEDLKVYERLVDVVAIADARFPNEINKIKEAYDATSINVINNFSQTELTSEQNKHESETALDDFDGYDYTLINTTFEGLEKDVNALVSEVEQSEK